TFGHTERRFGDKPATRYQEASFDIHSAENFHYRPYADHTFKLADADHTVLELSDPDAFADPRPFYYGAWVAARSRLQESTETSFSFFEKRNLGERLSDDVKRLIVETILPLRHAELGANMNNAQIAAKAVGTTMSQSHIFHGMDRLA